MKEIGYEANYQYAHNYDDHFVLDEYLPDKISNTMLYSPQVNTREKEFWRGHSILWKGKYGY